MGRAAAVLPATEVRVVRSSQTETDYRFLWRCRTTTTTGPTTSGRSSTSWTPIFTSFWSSPWFAMSMRVEFCNELPDALIVGIGCPVEGSLSTILHEVMHRRLRDFLPDRDPDGEEFIQQNFPVAIPALAGQAAAFWSFLHQELVLLIESEYRADSADRTLLATPGEGHSRSTPCSGSRGSSTGTSSRVPVRVPRMTRRMPASTTTYRFASTS
jgi:hypothetical protein